LAHLSGELNVENLATVVAMSPRNFARVFVRDTKITPTDFIESVRLMRHMRCWKQQAIP